MGYTQVTTVSNTKMIISRKDAQAAGLKRYFTGVVCKNGHVDERLCSTGACLTCNRENGRLNYNPEKTSERKKKDRAANPEKYRERKRRYCEENAEKVAEGKRIWIKRNPDKIREQSRRNRTVNKEYRETYMREWWAKNPEKANVYQATRIARINYATPRVREDLVPFLQAETLAIYAEARTLTELTGVPYHVDHIFPISKGGVHAPWNLRVMLGTDNLKKNAAIPKDEPMYVMWQGELMSRVKDTDQ